MKWEHESWRKLYTRVLPDWAALPLLCRGLGSELIKYCDDDGRIPMAEGESAQDTVVRLAGAHKSEVALVRTHVGRLIDKSYLIVDGGCVVIRNLKVAQKRSSADRTRRWRERHRDASRDSHSVTMSDASRDSHTETDSEIDLPPNPRGAGVLRAVGQNPRAAGTNPRAIAEDRAEAEHAAECEARLIHGVTPPSPRRGGPNA